MDSEKFRFSTHVRVRNFEVDWQGIVHNANYLQYFEIGRIEYLKNLGIPVDMHAIQNDSRVVVVRNEVDYRSPALFDELLEVRTRVAFVRTTSFGFEGIITEASNGRLVAENRAIHVWLDPLTNRPCPVNDTFRKVIGDFEGENVDFQANPDIT